MNKRLLKKLKKEMNSWTKDSKVRHRRSTFKKAWKFESEENLKISKKKENEKCQSCQN